MYFDSFSSFIDMGGHGFYVWLAYSVFLVIIFWNLILLKVKRRTALKEAQRAWQREKLKSKPSSLDVKS